MVCQGFLSSDAGFNTLVERVAFEYGGRFSGCILGWHDMTRGFTNRRCPKCNGNIFVEQGNNCGSEGDYHSWYEWCLQCGYTRYLKPAPVLTEEFEVLSVGRSQ